MKHTQVALAWSTMLIILLQVGLTEVVDAAPPGKVDVLIGFKNPPGQNERALVRAQGGTVNHVYTLIPSIAASVPPQALNALSNNPKVAVIEPDVQVQAIDYLAEISTVWGVSRIESDYAYLRQSSITGDQVKVAVIDSGIDTDHPDLAGNYVEGYDFVNNDSDPNDDNGHGTHCAGTIGAVAENGGVVGVAPGVSLYALKVLDANGSGSFSDVIAALQWCVDHGIHVTSNSYGSRQDPGTQVAAAFANAEQQGILSIAAAGNDGNVKGNGNNVGYPASYTSVVAVAATDPSDTRAYFSSTGPDVEVSAPGYQIYSTYLNGQYATLSGTSMACPHAAGAAALLIQAGLDAGVETNNAVVREALGLSCIDLGDTGRDSRYGYGLINVMSGVVLIETGQVVPPTVDPGTDPPANQSMTVATIGYSTSGGGQGTKDLLVTLFIQGETGAGVPGASVSITLNLNGNPAASGTGTTNSNGSITFRMRNASSGTWTTTVTDVTASGYSWDGDYPAPDSPENVFVK